MVGLGSNISQDIIHRDIDCNSLFGFNRLYHFVDHHARILIF